MPAPRVRLPRWNAARLAEIRRSLGISPESFAALINKHLKAGPPISGRKVRRWEAAGQYAPDAHELTAICAALHIEDVSTFFASVEERSKR